MALNRVQEKKVEVQKVAASYEKLCSGTAIESPLPASEHYLFQKNSDIEKRFASAEPAFLRTFRYTSDAEALSKSSHGKTFAKREIDALMNNVPGIEIIGTPSTLIGAQFKSVTLSLMEVPSRPKWKGLPSAVYFPAAVDESERQDSLRAAGLRRPGFGDLSTYQTGKVLYSLDLTHNLSHAEKLSVLEENSRQYMKIDPRRPRKGFSHSAGDLAADLVAREAAGPYLPHIRNPNLNEYFAKLEMWDLKAIEIGTAKGAAIAALIEFNVEMALLERSLSREGSNAAVLTDHLRRQLAWPADPSQAPVDLAGVEARLSGFSDSEKNAYLDGVLEQLRERVTLCKYKHNENGSGSTFHTLAFGDFGRDDILAGIKLYLDARLPNLSSGAQA